MKSKKIFALFASLLIIVYVSVELPIIIHAQRSTPITGDLPSDLSLDLAFAQQNPAPDQKQIVSSQTQQAVVVTATGETNVITPQDIVVPQVKTESQADAVNPEQTTSEQVVTKPVTVQVDDKGTPIPENSDNQSSPQQSTDTNTVSPTSSDNNSNSNPTTGTSNLVPGTNVVEPNDNSAPTDNSGNPNLPAPTAADNESGNNAQPSNSGGGSSNDQQNIPLESQPQTNPSSDNNGDNSPVQGASTGPKTNLFQKAIINIRHFLTGK